MSHYSRNLTIIKKIAPYFLQIQNEKEMQHFLKAILTKTEIEVIYARLQILQMLKQNIPQRKIAKKLKVGIATVSRGAQVLKQSNSII